MSSTFEVFGYPSHIWFDGVGKKITELMSGRGGVGSLLEFFDALGHIFPELAPVRTLMKDAKINYESVVNKCHKEQMERPLSVRVDEAVESLGMKCPECGFTTSGMTGEECPKCGSFEIEPVYVSILKEMIDRGIYQEKPEAVLIQVTFDSLKDAYVEAYGAIGAIMKKTAEVYGWEEFKITQPEFRDYVDRYRIGYLAGEKNISLEDKQLLQFLVLGNMAGIPKKEAEVLIRLGLEVVKWGFIYEQLAIPKARMIYRETVTKYNRRLDKMNRRIMDALVELYRPREEKRTQITVVEAKGYVPFLSMPKHGWESGVLTSDIALRPIYDFPMFPKADYGPVQVAYAPRGEGKTVILSSIACYAVQKKREIVFSPMNDKSNSFTFAWMPLFAYNERTQELMQSLETIGVEPEGVPVLTLTFLRKGEKIFETDKHPPTKFDRIIEVEDASGFEVDFDQIVDELKAVAELYGYNKPAGIINVRNMQRFDLRNRVYIDAQVASNMLFQFDRWKKGNSKPARVVIDEIHDIASAQAVLYAGDALRAAASISDFIKESRRNNLSIEVATQRPLEIIPDIQDAATNIFFRNLGMSKDKAKSQIDFLLDSLRLENPSEKVVVREINNRGVFRKTHFWFWYHQPSYSIEVVYPCPPTFCLHDPKKTTREVFRLYEKKFGEKVLLRSWDEVPVLKAHTTQLQKTGWPTAMDVI